MLSLAGCQVLDQAKTGFSKLNSAKQTVANINSAIKNRTTHHTVIVPGYGAPVKGNSTYEAYIKSVADYVRATSNEVNSVVFTGGYTTTSDQSEAEAMNSYFNSLIDTATLQQRGVKIYKEECAIVSWQNIANSQELLAAKDIQPTRVTIFGDQHRQDKLTTLAAYKFNLAEGLPDDITSLVNKSLNIASVNFQPFDFGNDAKTEEERQEIFAAEMLGAYDVNIGNQILGKRLTEWSGDFSYDVAKNLVTHGCTEYKGF